MFRFFDFVYFTVTGWYKKEKSPDFTGSVLVALFQCFNISSLIFIIDYFIEYHLASKVLAIVFAVALIIFNDRRYLYQEKNSYEEIKKRWNLLTPEQVGSLYLWVISYVIFSTVAIFGIAIFIGSKR